MSHLSDEARLFWLIVGIIALGIIGYTSSEVRYAAVFLGILFFGAGAVFFYQYHRLWPKIIEERYEHLQRKPIESPPTFREGWESIRHAMKSNDLSELRVTMIDADTLVEDLLRAQGIEGDTMAALIAEATLMGIAGTAVLLRFHRLRNRIVHESTFVPKAEEMKHQLAMLDSVLVKWGVLLP